MVYLEVQYQYQKKKKGRNSLYIVINNNYYKVKYETKYRNIFINNLNSLFCKYCFLRKHCYIYNLISKYNTFINTLLLL